jgi:hypothetical protein
MTEDTLHGLLLDCGFRNLLWTPLRGQLWAVVGDIDPSLASLGIGGVEITVACTPGPTLHVPSETARELLSEMLAQNEVPGAADVRIVADGRGRMEGSAWVPLAIGVGAVALFGWVISSLGR